MGGQYKFRNPDGIYFVTFSVVNWVDVFTRKNYADILVDSIKFCQREKGLELFAWVIMSNHVHLIAQAKAGYLMQNILRDLKKYTSKQIIKAIQENTSESRRNWMLEIFQKAGTKNCNNKNFQFWQQDNHPIVLDYNFIKQQKLKYLHNNPVKANIVRYPEDFVYSSASNYSGKEGLIDVLILE